MCTALAALVEEADFLKRTAAAKFYAQLALVGATDHDDAGAYPDGALEAMLGRALPLLQDAANFVSRVNAVTVSLVRQVAALFSRGSGFAGGFREVRLRPVVLALGDLLTVLITLDAIVKANAAIGIAWDKYKRLADVMRADPGRYGVDAGRAAAFDALLAGLDGTLLSAGTLRRCLDQKFEEGDAGSAYRDWLRDRALENVDVAVAVLGGELETTEAKTLVGQFAVYALYRALAGGRVPPDVLKKQFERLWKVTEAAPLVHLFGRAVWRPDAFLLATCPVPGLAPGKLTPRNVDAVRAAAADAAEAGIAPAANVLHARVSAWLVRAEMAFADAPLVARQPPSDILRARAVLLNQALCLAYGGSRTMTTYLAYTLTLRRDFKRKCVDAVARIAELLKALEGGLRAHAAALGESLTHIHRDNAVAMMEMFLPLRLRASAAKKSDETLKYVAAATELVQSLCLGTESWSKLRRIALDLALSVGLQPAAVPKDSEAREILRASWQLDLLADYQAHARAATDCSVLYWARDLLPAMVGGTVTVAGTAPADADSRRGSRLQYIFTAFSDAARMLALAIHLPPPPHAARRIAPDDGPAAAGGGGGGGGAAAAGAGAGADKPGGTLAGLMHPLTAYERYLHGVIASDIVQPLVRAVEADLRVTVHAVHLAHLDPPGLRTGRPPLVHLLALPPIRVVGALVDIRAEVTHALEKTFYELTTVALHDWKT